MKKIVLLGLVALAMTSCVSKKKYTELESKYKATQGNLARLKLENEKIQKHVENYNKKIVSLRGINGQLQQENGQLQQENRSKFDLSENVVMSANMKERMNETLAKVDPSVLANARTLKDSINIAISHNFKNRVNAENFEDENISVDIDETVVMITIADNLLFRSGSYVISRKADKVLRKLAEIIKSEPSMDVMIEGHTDSRSIHTGCIRDNWDLSVKRATSMVRVLEKKSGRGSSMPLFENNTRANRAKNRRTRVIILPNLDKFFGMLAEKNEI